MINTSLKHFFHKQNESYYKNTITNKQMQLLQKAIETVLLGP